MGRGLFVQVPKAETAPFEPGITEVVYEVAGVDIDAFGILYLDRYMKVPDHDGVKPFGKFASGIGFVIGREGVIAARGVLSR